MQKIISCHFGSMLDLRSIYPLTPVVHIVTETGDQEAETCEWAEVLPPARVDEAAVHHLGHCEGVPPVVVNNLK